MRVASETELSTIINSFALRVSGSPSAGLKAVAAVKAMDR
jgi:hypothetical protein